MSKLSVSLLLVLRNWGGHWGHHCQRFLGADHGRGDLPDVQEPS